MFLVLFRLHHNRVLVAGPVGLGPLLTAVGRRAGLTEKESAGFAQRDPTPGRPVDLD